MNSNNQEKNRIGSFVTRCQWLLLLPLALSACRTSPTCPAPDTGAALPGKAVVTSVKGNAEASTSTPSAPAKKPAHSKEVESLFDGTTLAGWKVTEFGGSGEVETKNGEIILHSGVILTGIQWTNEAVLPKTNYEISLEAKRIEGSDFFCALTFPVGDSHCTFVVGGWGGAIVGISSIDGMDASENETTKFMNFEKDKWYRIRARVTPVRLSAWINDEQMADQSIEGRRVSMRAGEIELSKPLGIATYQTSGAVRNIQIRRLQ